MSGHSKWATIKRAKGAADAKRGAVFTRLGREITIAAKEGGGNPDSNFRLRLAMDKAKAANMPKDNVERAINRGTGAGADATSYEELMYEGYLPLKVPAMIKVTTDNRNRTVAEVRKLLTKAGGSLGEGGSVGWQFDRKGYIVIERGEAKIDPDEVFMVAADAGADDVQTNDEAVEIYCHVDHLRPVREALVKSGYHIANAEITMIPTTQTNLSADEAERVLRVVDELEETDDVETVYHNLVVPEAVAA